MPQKIPGYSSGLWLSGVRVMTAILSKPLLVLPDFLAAFLQADEGMSNTAHDGTKSKA